MLDLDLGLGGPEPTPPIVDILDSMWKDIEALIPPSTVRHLGPHVHRPQPGPPKLVTHSLVYTFIDRAADQGVVSDDSEGPRTEEMVNYLLMGITSPCIDNIVSRCANDPSDPMGRALLADIGLIKATRRRLKNRRYSQECRERKRRRSQHTE